MHGLVQSVSRIAAGDAYAPRIATISKVGDREIEPSRLRSNCNTVQGLVVPTSGAVSLPAHRGTCDEKPDAPQPGSRSMEQTGAAVGSRRCTTERRGLSALSVIPGSAHFSSAQLASS